MKLQIITCLPYKKATVLFLVVLVPFLQLVLNVNFVPSKQLKLLIETDPATQQQRAESLQESDTLEDSDESIDFNSDDVKIPNDVNAYHEESSLAVQIYRGKSQVVSWHGAKKLAESVHLTVWSLNDRFGSVEDIYLLLRDFGIRFHHYELQTLCFRLKNCPPALKGLSVHQMLDTMPRISGELHEFLESIPEFVTSDAVLCVSPPSLCDIYKSFNKTKIIYIADRYNQAVTSPNMWHSWNQVLRKLAMDSRNILVASSEYESQYCNYFTLIEPKVLPPYAGYMKSHNLVLQNDVIGLKPFTDGLHNKKFLFDFDKISEKLRTNLNLYYYIPETENYRAIVYLPSHVSSLTFVEIYRLNIPIFAPSLELLTRWHYKDHVISYKSRYSGSVSGTPGRSEIRGTIQLPDPNNDKDLPSIGFWLQFMDIYVYPHVQYFQSMEQLVDKLDNLETAMLEKISQQMRKYNGKQMTQIRNDWLELLPKKQK